MHVPPVKGITKERLQEFDDFIFSKDFKGFCLVIAS